MKQVNQVKSQMKSATTSFLKQPSLWWGLVFALILVALGGMVAHQLFFAQKERLASAFENGQRVIIDLKTGQVSTGSPQAKQLHPDDTTLPATQPEEDQMPGGPAKPLVIPTGQEDAGPQLGAPFAQPVPPAAATPAPPAAVIPPVATMPTAPAPASTAEVPTPMTASPGVVAAPTDAVTAVPLQEAAAVAAPAPVAPKVAILVVGLGLSRAMSEKAISMDPVIALGFSTYAYNLSNWVKTAKKAKHEVFLNVAMEPTNYPADDPGPHALLTTQSDKENLKKLDDIFRMAEGEAGIYSIRDERFSLSTFRITPILKEIKKQNSLYIYGGDPGNHAIIQLATQLQAPMVNIDELIDEKLSQQFMMERLAAAEQKALTNGTALVMGRAYPITLRMLEAWLPTLAAKGIKVVPVEELAKK